MNRDFEKAVSEAERAMSLDPGSATVIHNVGAIFVFAGRYEDAPARFHYGHRLSPIANPTFQYNLPLLIDGRGRTMTKRLKSTGAICKARLIICKVK